MGDKIGVAAMTVDCVGSGNGLYSLSVALSFLSGKSTWKITKAFSNVTDSNDNNETDDDAGNHAICVQYPISNDIIV